MIYFELLNLNCLHNKQFIANTFLSFFYFICDSNESGVKKDWNPLRVRQKSHSVFYIMPMHFFGANHRFRYFELLFRYFRYLREKTFKLSPWVISAFLHLALAWTLSAVGSLKIFSLASTAQNAAEKKTQIQIIEKLTPPLKVKSPPRLDSKLSPQKLAKPMPPARQVFSSNKVTETTQDLINEKATDERVTNEDNSLPVAVEDFLVTEMPKIKNEVRAEYPKMARDKNIEGVVVLDVLIDEAGKVRECKIVEGPGYGLNEAAREAMLRFEFAPARIESQAVTVRIQYAYRFVLHP